MAKFDPTKDTNPERGSENDAPATNPYANAQYVPMPAGGLRALAAALFPGDVDNPDAMKQHVSDLLLLNADTLRNEDTYTAGQHVRIQ